MIYLTTNLFNLVYKTINMIDRRICKTLPIGTKRERKDGIYQKQPGGEWKKISEEKEKKEQSQIEEKEKKLNNIKELKNDTTSFNEKIIDTAKGKIKVPEKVKNININDYYSENTIKYYTSIYDVGKELKEKYGDDIEEAITNHPELPWKKIFNSPAANSFFESGFYDKAIPKLTVGWRYGNADNNTTSHNYREDEPEKGLSMMQLAGRKKISTTYELLQSKGQKIHWFVGFQIDDFGADGEPLITGNKKIV